MQVPWDRPAAGDGRVDEVDKLREDARVGGPLGGPVEEVKLGSGLEPDLAVWARRGLVSLAGKVASMSTLEKSDSHVDGNLSDVDRRLHTCDLLTGMEEGGARCPQLAEGLVLGVGWFDERAGISLQRGARRLPVELNPDRGTHGRLECERGRRIRRLGLGQGRQRHIKGRQRVGWGLVRRGRRKVDEKGSRWVVLSWDIRQGLGSRVGVHLKRYWLARRCTPLRTTVMDVPLTACNVAGAGASASRVHAHAIDRRSWIDERGVTRRDLEDSACSLDHLVGDANSDGGVVLGARVEMVAKARDSHELVTDGADEPVHHWIVQEGVGCQVGDGPKDRGSGREHHSGVVLFGAFRRRQVEGKNRVGRRSGKGGLGLPHAFPNVARRDCRHRHDNRCWHRICISREVNGMSVGGNKAEAAVRGHD